MGPRILLVALLSACGFSGPIEDGTAPDASGIVDPEMPQPFSLDDCPADYEPVQNAPSRYRTSWPMTYRAAHLACKGDSNGHTHLVVVDTLHEAVALRVRVYSAEYWTGTVQAPNQTSVATGWFTITGGAVPAVWASSEPDESGNKEAGVYNVAKFESGGLNDDKVSDSAAMVCECDGRAADPLIEGYIR